MTCAHEIGHHVFGHGARLDRCGEEGQALQPSADEWLATLFGAHLLMPRAAVLHGLHRRSLDPRSCPPEDLLTVAGWLGVGYGALVRHMQATLGLIPRPRGSALLEQQPQVMRRTLAARLDPSARSPDTADADLFVIDADWTGRPVDLRVGDLAILPESSRFEGGCAAQHGTLLIATRPGVGRLAIDSTEHSMYVRVRRTMYVGLAEVRHLEDPDQ